MNLNKLFETQRKLDERIVKEKGLEGQDLLPKKILALQVELGELANEWRGFKFWSENQEPRTINVIAQQRYSKDRQLKYVHYTKGEGNPLLEEYVDCLHFILSIGLEHKFDDLINILEIEPLKYSNTIVDQFTDLFVSDWNYYEEGFGAYYHEGLELFLGLGELLGFTWEQIETAYYEKNKVNHQRQESGY